MFFVAAIRRWLLAKLVNGQNRRNSPQPSIVSLLLSWLLGTLDVLYVLLGAARAFVLVYWMKWRPLFPGGLRKKQQRLSAGINPNTGKAVFFRRGWGDIDRLWSFAETYKTAFHVDDKSASASCSPPGSPSDGRLFTATHARDKAREHWMFELDEANVSSRKRAAMHLAAGALTKTPHPLTVDIYEFDYESPVAELLRPASTTTTTRSTPSVSGAPRPPPQRRPGGDKENPDEGDDTRDVVGQAHSLLVWPRGHALLPCFYSTVKSYGASACSTPVKGRTVGSSSTFGGPSSDMPVKGVMVLLPGVGETTPDARLNLAAWYASAYQYATIIPTAPFYGSRRPACRGTGPELDTLGEALLQSHALATETAAVVLSVLRCSSALRTRDNTAVPVVIGGGSWGATQAVLATATVCGFATDSDREELCRVGCVPYVGAPSAAPFTDGMLADRVDWGALVEAGRGPFAPAVVSRLLRERRGPATHEAVVDVATKILRSIDTARIVAFLPKAARRQIRAVFSAVAANDRFVSWELGAQLHSDATSLLHPQGHRRVDILGGGHVLAFTTMSWRLAMMVPSTAEAIRELVEESTASV